MTDSWVNWTPDDGIGPIAGADSKDGLRTPFVFSSALSEVGSYLRFANADVSSGTVSLTISDTFTGEIISNWQSPSIAPFASLQFAMADIEVASQPSINPTSHTAYSIAIESTFEGYFQHVLYSAAGESLTNVTGCEAGLSGDTSLLMNMHTTDIGSYPSNIVFHNVGPSSSTPEMTIYDAANGDELGTIFPLSPIPPDGSILFDVSAIQDALDFIPSSQPHLNLRLSGAFRGYVQHFVDNEGSGVVTNMTSKCNIGFF